MPWLLRDGEVLATLEVADAFLDRARGLLGRDGIDGALLLHPARSVHTIGMRFPIDVAFCDADLVVITTMCLERHRVCLPRVRARSVVEAEAGAFERWKLRVGDRLEIKG
ncbi:MAG TPA: DUF192 domain-containing protein [Acidimicrobiales bacterium]